MVDGRANRLLVANLSREDPSSSKGTNADGDVDGTLETNPCNGGRDRLRRRARARRRRLGSSSNRGEGDSRSYDDAKIAARFGRPKPTTKTTTTSETQKRTRAQAKGIRARCEVASQGRENIAAMSVHEAETT